MTPTVLAIIAFVGVVALVIGAFAYVRGGAEAAAEERLEVFTGLRSASLGEAAGSEGSLLARPLDDGQDFFTRLFQRFGNLQRLFEQADVKLTPSRFFAISAITASLGGILCVSLGAHPGFAPIVAIILGIVPFLYILFKRSRRLKAFAGQLPDALDLMSRSLRAGHSLQAGFDMVGQEMNDPIAKEFSAVFEAQNLGVSLEEALDDLSERIPNMDLRFFATAVTLQRSTGGDLAEILDKIGNLIRERFRIRGQVQALTGEGRMSGAVLLAMPPVLGLVVYYLNAPYVMLLFTDPMGQKMLVGAVIAQLLGAIVIRKIINIKI
jgi:tight adherence protein B